MDYGTESHGSYIHTSLCFCSVAPGFGSYDKQFGKKMYNTIILQYETLLDRGKLMYYDVFSYIL